MSNPTPFESYQSLVSIIKKLRSPNGCPWDKEQNPETMRSFFVEESWELIHAINVSDVPNIREEIGDIYLLLVSLTEMYEEKGIFTHEEVLKEIGEKLIRRHPHVFGEITVKDSVEVIKNWDAIKQTEKKHDPKTSVLDKIPLDLPPLEQSFQIQKKAAKMHFDWEDHHGVLDKIREEIDELQEAIEKSDSSNIEEELGDLLFSVANLSRKLKKDPSVALDSCNQKFRKRFAYVCAQMQENGIPMAQNTLSDMERFWQESKSEEKN